MRMNLQKSFLLIFFLIFLMDTGAITAIVSADPQIPAGQDVGAREREYEWQKRNEALKRRLARKKKKSKIEDKTITETGETHRKKTDDVKNSK